MFFTQNDYKKIQQWLTNNSIKDTEFNEAYIPFKGNEIITIVQDSQNKKVLLKDLVAQIFNLGVSDFINISEKYDAYIIDLEEAIKLIPYKARKKGQVITFLNKENLWQIYQFKGALNQWNILDQWEDLFANIIIDSILPDEEDLTKSLPDENGNSYLSLKDREYKSEDFSGLGRVILRKNIIEFEDPIYGKVKKNILYQNIFTQSNTIYEIRYDFDLNDSEITIPEDCVLDFQGGSLSNGVIIGNNTIIDTYQYAIFRNIILRGDYICPESNSLMFDDTINDNILFSNLGVLSRVVRVFNNREYQVTKEAVVLEIDKLFAIGEKPTINFLDGNNGEYNDTEGFVFNSKTLLIENIKFTENFDPETSNQVTIGNAIGHRYTTRNTDIYTKISNCEFTGSFSSSCFASSYATGVEVVNCNFHDCYLADHAVYSSTNTHFFRIIDCKATNIINTTGLFKVRESPNFVLYEVDGLKAVDVEDYLFFITMMADEIDRKTNIITRRVTMTQTSDTIGNGTYGLLNTSEFEGRAKVNTILIEDCFIHGGQYNEDGSYKERSLFSFGNGKPVSVSSFVARRNKTDKMSIENQYVENTVIENSSITLNSSIYANTISITNCDINIYRSTLKSLFVRPKNAYIKNTSINGTMTYLCLHNYEHSGVNYIFSLDGCKINKLSRNVFSFDEKENPQLVYYVEKNCDIVRGANYDLTYGAVIPTILNRETGKFAVKPNNPPIGHPFFCTDKKTEEGTSNGIMIYHKGNNVWVDALGRVVE